MQRRASARAGRSARQLHLRRAAGAPGVERSATEAEALNQLGLTFDQVGKYSHVIDFVYRSGSTPLLAAARAHGARTVDGLEVLVAQGALSFELWTGRAAPLEVMRTRRARGATAAHGLSASCARRPRDERAAQQTDPDLHAIFGIDGPSAARASRVIAVERADRARAHRLAGRARRTLGADDGSSSRLADAAWR